MPVCKVCGRYIKSLGYARHRAMHAERRAAQGERSANVKQQANHEICPRCAGKGKLRFSDGVGWTCREECPVCKGAGKLS
jgi:DnaJ-class molecular chaperone